MADTSSTSRFQRVAGLVGEAPALTQVMHQAMQVAETDATVLITGESGTGKELVARGIHRCSHRSERGFVPINLGAMAEGLCDSEFFGHVRGAFTGAQRDRLGYFRSASGGTLLLDEIGEASPIVQTKLLRVIEQSEVRPVGADQQVPINVRIIAATNVDLGRAVLDGSFRMDLYYRLNVLTLALPPLRDRTVDIPILSRHFTVMHSHRLKADCPVISDEAMSVLISHEWPGNVRELSHVMERAVVLHPGIMIGRQMIRELVTTHPGVDYNPCADQEQLASPTPPVSADYAMFLYSKHILAEVSGNKARAADLLGVARSTLRRRLRKWAGLGWHVGG